MKKVISASRELLLPIGTIIICTAIYLDSVGARHGSVYDLLGAAGFPRITIGILALLSLYLIGTVLLESSRPGAADALVEQQKETGPETRREFWLILGLTVIYALSINYRVDFAFSTFGFLLVASLVLSQWNVRTLVVGALVAAVVAWGCNYAFTKIFLIDLP